jgi:hypothetical protein
MSIAVFIKSESGDSYLYNFENEVDPQGQAAAICPEDPEHWGEYMEAKSYE